MMLLTTYTYFAVPKILEPGPSRSPSWQAQLAESGCFNYTTRHNIWPKAFQQSANFLQHNCTGDLAETVPEAACTSSSYVLYSSGEVAANIAEDMQNVSGKVLLTCVGTGPTKVSSARLGDLPPPDRLMMLEVPSLPGLATGWRF